MSSEKLKIRSLYDYDILTTDFSVFLMDESLKKSYVFKLEVNNVGDGVDLDEVDHTEVKRKDIEIWKELSKAIKQLSFDDE